MSVIKFENIKVTINKEDCIVFMSKLYEDAYCQEIRAIGLVYGKRSDYWVYNFENGEKIIEFFAKLEKDLMNRMNKRMAEEKISEYFFYKKCSISPLFEDYEDDIEYWAEINIIDIDIISNLTRNSKDNIKNYIDTLSFVDKESYKGLCFVRQSGYDHWTLQFP